MVLAVRDLARGQTAAAIGDNVVTMPLDLSSLIAERLPSRRVWAPVRDGEIGRRVVDESLALLATRGIV